MKGIGFNGSFGRNVCLIMTVCFFFLTVAPLLALGSHARWIWRPGGKAEYGERILLRKEFTLEQAPTSGFLNIIGDDHCTLFLNGEKLYHQSGLVARRIDAKKLKAGRNVISAVIKNDKDVAGLLIYGEIVVSGKNMMFVTDKSWKVHAPDIIDQTSWKVSGYDDSKWKNAVEISGVTTQNIWRQYVKPELFLSKPELDIIRAKEQAQKEYMNKAIALVPGYLAKSEQPKHVEFVRKNNVPFISIDHGKKLLPAPYLNTVTYTRVADHKVFDKFQRYGSVGYEVATSAVQMEKVWVSEDVIDMSSAERAMQYLFAAFPETYVLVHISLKPPKWFTDKYPGELIRYGSGSDLYEGDDAAARVPRPSMVSELWKEKAGKALTKIIRNMETSEYGKRIIGYQINYGVYSEWHYYGMEKQLPDTSIPMQKAFTKYLKEKYRNDKALQTAWKDPSVTLQTAKIPTVEQRLKQKQDVPVLSGEDCRCQDFYDCIALEVNNCQTFFNMTVKKSCNRRVIVGNYSGYFFSMPYPAVGFQIRTPDMLKTDAVDYQVTPFSYFLYHRCNGGSGLPRSPYEAYAFHNKVAVLEADNRTHQATTRSGNTCKTAADSIGQISREFCNALTKGAALWYYDFNIWWYDYPEYYELFPKLLKIWKEGNDATRVSEVAGVCDFSSIPYHTASRNPNKFTDKITGDVCHEMYYAGAPFDTILMENLGKPGTPDYKVYVFFNLVHLTDWKLKEVEKLLDRGAFLVFICAPELEKKFVGRKNVLFMKNKVLSRWKLHSILKAQGVHIYSNDVQAVLFASRGLVGINRSKAGPATIKLPAKAKKIEQVLPVRRSIPASDVITYQHGTAETSLFRIQY